MDAASLFVETMDDLLIKVRDGASPYEALRSATLVYQLIMDGLADQANRAHRLRVKYRVAGVNDYERAVNALGGLQFQSVHLDPATSILPSAVPVDMTRDEFLARPAIYGPGNQAFGVSQVVRTARNVLGGQHLGPGRDDAQRFLKAIDEQLAVGSYSAVIHVLPSIGRVVHRALSPLEACIRS